MPTTKPKAKTTQAKKVVSKKVATRAKPKPRAKILKTGSITQSIILNCKPSQVFKLYLSAKQHSTLISNTAIISSKRGAEFSMWDGTVHGYNIDIDPKQFRIEQAWCADSKTWPTKHYSHLVIELKPHNTTKTKLTMTQRDVRSQDVDDVAQGWKDFYWQPMQELFNTK